MIKKQIECPHCGIINESESFNKLTEEIKNIKSAINDLASRTDITEMDISLINGIKIQDLNNRVNKIENTEFKESNKESVSLKTDENIYLDEGFYYYAQSLKKMPIKEIYDLMEHEKNRRKFFELSRNIEKMKYACMNIRSDEKAAYCISKIITIRSLIDQTDSNLDLIRIEIQRRCIFGGLVEKDSKEPLLDVLDRPFETRSNLINNKKYGIVKWFDDNDRFIK